MLQMTENVGLSNLSLVGRIKMVLQEATERQTNHDFNTDMALRAQQTAELYQIIDGISKDESKLEILQTKQRFRDRIQEVESDIKAQVSQLLDEEAIEKANKVLEKDKGKQNVKPLPLRTIQATPRSHEIKSKQIPSSHSFLSPGYRKSDGMHNLVKIQTLEHRSCPPLLSNVYPAKQYVLPMHSCSCLQNAYFYPLAQPSRIRKQEVALKTPAFTSNNNPKILSPNKIYVKRGEPTTQYENLLRNTHQNQTEIDLKEPFYSRTLQNDVKLNSQEKFETEVKERKHSLPESFQVSRFTESKSTQSSGIEKKNKSKYVQTDKHITWKSPKRKSSEKNPRKAFGKQRFPNSVRSPYSQPVVKLHTPTKISASLDVRSSNLDNIHRESEQAIERNSNMNDHLVESIKYLEARSQSELIHNLSNIDNLTESGEMETASQPVSYIDISDILNRILSNNRNEEDVAALCSALSILQETNTQDSNNPSADRTPSIDKDLLEKLIVDVIYEDLKGFSSPLEKSIASNETTDLEVASTKSNAQQNLDTDQHSEQEHEESELSASKVLRNVVTPELSRENSMPSSSSSSPSSSPHFMDRALPTTPLLSEQESTSEEILLPSQPKEDAEAVNPIPTPDLTPPLDHSPKHYVATPPPSPHPQNISESESHDMAIKKSVCDASVQVSKLSNSGESTLGTIATSISDTTDEFLSDGELLLKGYGQVSHPAQMVRQQKKNSVTIQDYPVEKVTSQISKSSLSEGEVPLLTTGMAMHNPEHPFQLRDSSIDETQLPGPTNSTFEQIWDDISEGQIVPQHLKGKFKSFHLNFYEAQYQRQLSNTLSEGEIISTPQAEATSCKSPSVVKQDNFNHSITFQKQPQNNMSVSSGEIEEDEDEKLNKNLIADEEENIPDVTDAEFFDEEKEPLKVQD